MVWKIPLLAALLIGCGLADQDSDPVAGRNEAASNDAFKDLADFIDQRVWKTKNWSSTDSNAGVLVQGVRVYLKPYYYDGFCRSELIWISYPETLGGQTLPYVVLNQSLASKTPEAECGSGLALDDFFNVGQGQPEGEFIKIALTGFKQAFNTSRDQLAQIQFHDETVLPKDCDLDLDKKLASLDMTIEPVPGTNSRYTIAKATINTRPLCEDTLGNYTGISFEVDYGGEIPKIINSYIMME